MAAIQNPLLTIEEISDFVARVTVRYTVFQHPLEYWANTIYTEEISLIGDDPPFNPTAPSGTDITVAVFPPYSVRNPNAPLAPPIFTFERQRVLHVALNTLNEDPGFDGLGRPLRDEVFGLIKLYYAANVPWPFPGPFPPSSAIAATAQTNTVSGRW
jgi:hypothetical protein